MIFEKVRAILAYQFNIDEDKLTMETRLDDLRADPLDIVEFIMMLEREFDIEFEDDKLDGYTTVREIVESIRK